MEEKKLYPTKCERCGKDFKRNNVIVYTTSWFNLEHICIDCRDKERAHPDFKKAKQAELEACKQGNYNFPGIGKPADL